MIQRKGFPLSYTKCRHSIFQPEKQYSSLRFLFQPCFFLKAFLSEGSFLSFFPVLKNHHQVLWLCVTVVLSFPTAATSTTTGWQAHYLSLSAEYCLTNETQIKLYKLSSRHRRARLEESQCSLNAPSTPPHRRLHDAFVTHSVCQALKCDFYVRVCVETPIVLIISMPHLFVDSVCGFTFSFDSQTELLLVLVV